MSEDTSFLTEVHRQRFEEHINSKVNLIGKCPICSTRNWRLLDNFVRLSLHHVDGKATLGGDVYPNVGLLCTTCGNTQLINALISGVIKPEEVTGLDVKSEGRDG